MLEQVEIQKNVLVFFLYILYQYCWYLQAFLMAPIDLNSPTLFSTHAAPSSHSLFCASLSLQCIYCGSPGLQEQTL